MFVVAIFVHILTFLVDPRRRRGLEAQHAEWPVFARILLNHLSDVKEVLLVARKIGVGKIQVFVKVCCFTPYVWLWLILFSQKKG